MDRFAAAQDNGSMAKQVRRTAPKSPVRHYLREWRTHRHLTQEQLADRVECSRGLISQYEKGITEIPEGMVYALADALSTEPGDIFNVNPLKEGEVVDLLRLLKDADPSVQKEILDFAAFKLNQKAG